MDICDVDVGSGNQGKYPGFILLQPGHAVCEYVPFQL